MDLHRHVLSVLKVFSPMIPMIQQFAISLLTVTLETFAFPRDVNLICLSAPNWRHAFLPSYERMPAQATHSIFVAMLWRRLGVHRQPGPYHDAHAKHERIVVIVAGTRKTLNRREFEIPSSLTTFIPLSLKFLKLMPLKVD